MHPFVSRLCNFTPLTEDRKKNRREKETHQALVPRRINSAHCREPHCLFANLNSTYLGNLCLSIFYLRFLSGRIAALSAMSTIPQGPVEARSLSSVTTIASNPPAYPRNPTHEKHEPLSLYIVRVPGSKGMNQFTVLTLWFLSFGLESPIVAPCCCFNNQMNITILTAISMRRHLPLTSQTPDQIQCLCRGDQCLSILSPRRDSRR